jgi:PadR family transcriptional regulator PadR
MDYSLKPLYTAFMRLHILHHAGEGKIYGSGIKQELERHGYRISCGTLYPLLHELEERGYLGCSIKVEKGKRRKYYELTAKGRRFLIKAKEKLKELSEELL